MARTGPSAQRLSLDIAAEVVRRTREGHAPDRDEIGNVFPQASLDQIQAGFRIGSLDLILEDQAGPIDADTEEGRALIRARIQRLNQWKRAHGGLSPQDLDSVRVPLIRHVSLSGPERISIEIDLEPDSSSPIEI